MGSLTRHDYIVPIIESVVLDPWAPPFIHGTTNTFLVKRLLVSVQDLVSVAAVTGDMPGKFPT